MKNSSKKNVSTDSVLTKIFAIKNEKINFFNRPIYCTSHNEALSMIQNILMSDADRALIGLKSDLSLYFLGTINFVTGEIISSGPELVCTLEDIFDSIPVDKLSPAITRNDLVSVWDKIKKLEESIGAHS